MSSKLIRALPSLGVLAILVLLGPACGSGGGDSSSSSGGGIAFVPPPVVTTPPPTPPVPMVNRTAGVAPLGVFCCAANAFAPGSTTTFIPTPSDMDFSTFDYAWDFGDPGSGTWSTTGKSKNTAVGYTSAHIYETPGTYTITLTIVGAAGTVGIYTQAVVVSAFSGTDYYISAAGGNDANDGLTPGTAWATAAKVFANIATNRRFLFNRGETFNCAGGFAINPPGPGIIGAYGAGAKPKLNVTGTSGGIAIRNHDWVIQDLELSGQGAADTSNAVTLEATKQINHALMLRLTVHDFRVGIGWSDYPTMYATPHDGNIIADCFSYNAQVNGLFVGGMSLGVLGNIVQDAFTSHICRVWQAYHGVIAHNQFLRPGNDRHSLKMHSPLAGDGRPETQFVTVSDNTFEGNVWSVVIGPEDEIHDERVTQVVFERNTCNTVSWSQVLVLIKAREITVRNNLFVGKGGSGSYSAVGVGQNVGAEPPAKNVRILNNTCYKQDAGSQFTICSFNVRCSDVTVRNNLASAPGTTATFVTTGACPNLVADHNLISATPGFLNAGAGDYRLSGGSAAINAGLTSVQVRRDYADAPRPAGAATDIGAFEQ